VYYLVMARVSERWDFRVAPETDDLVRRAADASDRSLTDFVVAAARVEAERILADRTTFVLSPEQWERFIDVLDRPERDNPGLARLFIKPSVFHPRDK
jgi:uncharacterized protein (DUF1778 family)